MTKDSAVSLAYEKRFDHSCQVKTIIFAPGKKLGRVPPKSDRRYKLTPMHEISITVSLINVGMSRRLGL